MLVADGRGMETSSTSAGLAFAHRSRPQQDCGDVRSPPFSTTREPLRRVDSSNSGRSPRTPRARRCHELFDNLEATRGPAIPRGTPRALADSEGSLLSPSNVHKSTTRRETASCERRDLDRGDVAERCWAWPAPRRSPCVRGRVCEWEEQTCRFRFCVEGASVKVARSTRRKAFPSRRVTWVLELRGKCDPPSQLAVQHLHTITLSIPNESCTCRPGEPPCRYPGEPTSTMKGTPWRARLMGNEQWPGPQGGYPATSSSTGISKTTFVVQR